MNHWPMFEGSAIQSAAKAVSGFVSFSRRVGARSVAGMIGDALEHPTDDYSHGPSVPTVLFIQGIGCRSGVMRILGDEMKHNFNVAYGPDWSRAGFSDIYSSSAAVRQRIDEVNKVGGDAGLFVVTHSLGGPASLESLRHRNGVDRLVMLAPPFNSSGVPLARILSRVSAACRQLLPNADFFSHLSTVNVGHTEVECHVAESDSIVPSTSQLPPSTIPSRVVRHEGYGHHDFISGDLARVCAREIREALKAA